MQLVFHYDLKKKIYGDVAIDVDAALALIYYIALGVTLALSEHFIMKYIG